MVGKSTLLLIVMLLSFTAINCQSCSGSQTYNPVGGFCASSCPSGYYYYPNYDAQACWPIGSEYGACQTAWYSPSGLQCTQCAPGSYLNADYFASCSDTCPPGTFGYNSTCVQSCPSGTITSVSDGVCCDSTSYNPIGDFCTTTCPSGYYYYPNFPAQACWPIGSEYGACQTAWYSPSGLQCTQCAPGSYLNADYFVSCSDTCPPGTFGYDSTCVQSCPSGTITSVSDSICCDSASYNPIGDFCTTTCPSGYYYYPNFPAQACWPIGSEYGACQTAWYSPSGLQCTQCATGLSLSADYFAACQGCPPGAYFSGSACETCSNGCSACNSASNCLSCHSGYYLSASSCVVGCPSGCATCDGNGICTGCNSGYYLSGSSCVAGCPTGCATCGGDGICTGCNSGYYLSGSTCVAGCPTGCATCNGFGQCLTCNTGYYLSATSCATGCPTGCTACDTYGNCTKCSSGYYLAGTNCVFGKAPIVCPSQCASCTSSFTCTSCQSPSYLLPSLNECVENCPPGYVVSPNGKSCVVCPSNCKTCIGGFVCTACNAGYLLLAHGYVTHIDAYQCVTSCPVGYALSFYTNPITGAQVFGSDGSDGCIPIGTNNQPPNVATVNSTSTTNTTVNYIVTGAPTDETMVDIKKPYLSSKFKHQSHLAAVLSA